MKSMRLAWRYVQHHRMKSVLMVFCIVLTVLLPVALGILLSSFNKQIVARANATPLLVGARGSRVDLTMHALYFQVPVTDTIRMGLEDSIKEFGQAIPIHVRISADHIPVVGTTLEYFEFRKMSLRNGDGLMRLGDCVLGSNVARLFNKEPGDFVLTDRENVFEIAGDYPLKMRVAGILNRTRTADDDAIFVDIKTAWVVEGFGHGHNDVTRSHDDNLVMDRQGNSVTLSPAVLPYTEITDDNIGSFHFHGDFAGFPVTSLIVIPRDNRSEALLQGRFDSSESVACMCKPIHEVETLMGLVFRVQKFFYANAILIGVSTLLLLVLVVALSIRLREREMQTMFKMGCSRATIFKLIAAELLLVFFCAAIVVSVSAWTIGRMANEIVSGLLVG